MESRTKNKDLEMEITCGEGRGGVEVISTFRNETQSERARGDDSPVSKYNV